MPASAIVERDGHSVIFVIDGDTARLRRVAPPPQDYGGLRLLPDGVTVGTSVVDEPHAGLQDGSTVETNYRSPAIGIAIEGREVRDAVAIRELQD